MSPAENQSSARLHLPYLQAGQMQKHVTLNEALARLDALVQTSVVSRTVTNAPSSPQEGALHILPPSAEGDQWSQFSPGDLVRHENGGWRLISTPPGLCAFVRDEARLIVRTEAGWSDVNPVAGRLDDLEGLGVGTASDEVNTFAAKLNAALWTARHEGEGGTGDLRYVLNKQSAAHVLSILFQSDWAGRAEIGLIGGDDLTIKVSPDGDQWREGLSLDRSTGRVRLYGIGDLTSDETLRILESMPAAPGRRRAFLIDDLVGTLQDAGVWDRLDLLYVLAAADGPSALINWRQPGVHDLTAVGGPAFTKDRGFTGDGSSAWLNAGTSFTALDQYSQDDAVLFSWSLTALFENGRPDLGATGGVASSIYSGSASGNLGVAVNGANTNVAVATSAGLSAVSRAGAAVRVFKDGLIMADRTQPSSAPGGGDIAVLRTANSYSTRQIAAAGCGKSLDDGQHRILHRALKTYLTALGAL